MRRSFSDYIENVFDQNPEIYFLTGDLGFNAFENLRKKLGNHFINCGIAEQSMVSTAAGLASQGHIVFVYSIAPFLVYRALEQIRNDVCFHDLPVCIVGNGGGYGYGIMGSSHHALNDIACMASLPSINCYIPAFKEDVGAMVQDFIQNKKPSYLRLGLGKAYQNQSHFSGTFQEVHRSPASRFTLVTTGPLIWNILNHQEIMAIKSDIDIFLIQQMPFQSISKTLKQSLSQTERLLVYEEHTQVGGIGQSLTSAIIHEGIPLKSFIHRYANYYPSATYGDQAFHQRENGLDGESIYSDILNLIS